MNSGCLIKSGEQERERGRKRGMMLLKTLRALKPWSQDHSIHLRKLCGAQTSCHVGELTPDMWLTMATLTTQSHLLASRDKANHHLYSRDLPVAKSPVSPKKAHQSQNSLPLTMWQDIKEATRWEQDMFCSGLGLVLNIDNIDLEPRSDDDKKSRHTSWR